MIKLTTTFFALLFFIGTVANGQAPLVSLQDNKLVYNSYANRGQTNLDNQVPDFSNSGYRGGGVKLPVLPVKETLTALTEDNRAAIQTAIDKVAALPPDANGFRGAVLLKAGVYPVEGTLYIKANGVVLRGEGNSLTGTVLIATQKLQHNLIEVNGTGSGFSEVSGSKVRITSDYVGTAAKTFSLANHSFQVGDNVVIQKTPNDAWITALNTAQYGWTASGYRTQFERKITAVNGNEITVDIPVMDPMETTYGGGEVYKSNITGRVSDSGVENMRMESVFIRNTDESHGWNAIEFNRAENCWVKGVVAKYFGNAGVNLSTMSRFNTVEDCAMIDPKSQTTGGRKYSFNLESNSTSNLFQRCMTWGGRHDYVTGSKVPGPNVFLDCISENTFSDIGPHHRWATGLLFDNIYGGEIRVQNRGASGSGHGWAGAQIMFWNCRSVKSEFEVESPPTARNWGIGCIGLKQVNNGYWESWGTHVALRSLYLQQLQDRLGSEAVSNIIVPAQLTSNLWTSLRSRANQIAAEPQMLYGSVNAGDLEAFDVTDNGGVLTSQYESNRPLETSQNIIDNNVITPYYQNGRKALWVQYRSRIPAIVTSYTITSARDVEERDPKDWNLQGSTNGTTWVTLDTRTNEDFPTRTLTRTFTIPNTRSFTFYRLNITANGENSNTQFAEWELFQRKTQQISFGQIPTKTYGDEPFELLASANSGLPVALSIVTGPATIDAEGILTITGAGTITIKATQAGTNQYFPVTSEQTFIVNKAEQEITFAAISTKTFGDDPVALAASTDSNLPVTFTLVSGPAILDGNILTLTGAGEITVKALQAGNENYLSAEAGQTFTVSKAPQIITFEPVPAKTFGDAPFALAATVDSDLPLSFAVVSGPATISGNLITITGAGEVTVSVSQSGNENYLAAEAEQTFTIKKAPQNIAFGPVPTVTFGDGPFALTATVDSDLPLSFAVVAGPVSISGNMLTITGAGEATITVNQSDNENYLPATVSQTFTVNKAAQEITFATIGTKTYGDAPFALIAITDTNLTVTFKIVSGPATLDGNILTITGSGEITVRALQAGNENYLPEEAGQTFRVNKASQEITFAAIGTKNITETVTLAATSSVNLPVSYAVISGPGAIEGNILSFSGDGQVVVAASQAGNENYLAANQVNQTILVFADDAKKDGIKLIVYPNPTKGQLKVKLENRKDKDYTFSIYNSNGDLITSTGLAKSHKMFEVDFDLENSSNGFYYLHVSDGSEIIVRRIAKE